jgi:hypothetical protein
VQGGNIVKKLNLRIYWWRGKEFNFGDEVTPWLMQKMFDIKLPKPCKLGPGNNDVALAVGSIMRLSSPNTYVWGSGIRNIDQSDFSKARKYCAVRGPFTRRQLLKLGFECPEVYGDPGLLLPKFYNPKQDKTHKVGIIPHISEYDDLHGKYKNVKGIKIIDLRTNNIESVVNEILSCDSTVSSSLHGVITSVAYNIPTRWLKFSNRITGDDIKFYDFFASLDPKLLGTVHIKGGKANDVKGSKFNPVVYSKKCLSSDYLNSIAIQYDHSNIDVDKLITACPIRLL